MILSSIRDVVFGYGDEPVIDRLSLDLEAGQFIGITGPNGAAKTTLLKLMLGLLKPWSGTVTLNREITGGQAYNRVCAAAGCLLQCRISEQGD